MAFHRIQDVWSPEHSAHRKLGEVHRIEREYVMMRDRIVPGRARPVVSVIITLHLLITRKPQGVIVDALPRCARPLRSRLSASCYPVGKFSRAYGTRVWIEIH